MLGLRGGKEVAILRGWEGAGGPGVIEEVYRWKCVAKRGL